MGLREGSPRALTRGTPAAPSRARVAFRGHGTRPVLPAGSFSLHTGSQGAPPLCAHGNPQAHLGPAIWATARPKAGAGLVTHLPTGPPPPSRPRASGGAGGLTGALSSLALAAAGTDLPVWPPEMGVKPQPGPLSPRRSLCAACRRPPSRPRWAAPSGPLCWASGSSLPPGQGLPSGAPSPVLSEAK